MSNLEVALRLKLERLGFDEGKRDLDELRKSAAALGRPDAGGGGLARPLKEAGDEAKRARDEMERLGRSQDGLKNATGLEVMRREAARLDAAIEATGRRAKELHAAADNLKTADGAKALEQTIARLGRSGEKSREELRNLKRTADELGAVDGADQLREALDRVSGRARTVDEAIDGVRRSVDRLGRENGAEELRRDFEAAARSAEMLERRTQGAARAAARVSAAPLAGGSDRSLREFGREAWQESGGTRFLPLGAGLGAAGMAGFGAGAAAYGAGRLGTASAGRAMDTEGSLADVERSLNDPTAAQMRAIEAGVAALSRRDGIDAGAYYSFITEAAKGGVAYDDLLGFAGFGQRFALAADMSGGEAGEALAKIRNNYGLDLDGLRSTADTVNYLADNDAAKERNIVDFMRRASGNARIASMSADQMASYGTVFDSLGVESSVGGTAMNAMIMRLGTASQRARTDQPFARSLGRLGLSGGQLQRDFFADGNAAILDVLQRVQQQPQERQLEILRGIGGEEYGDDLALLVSQIERLIETQERLNDPAREGSVDRTFEIFDRQTRQDLRRAGAALADLGSEIGKNLLPAIRTVADIVASLAGSWADSIRRRRTTDDIVERVERGEALTPEDRAAIADNRAIGGAVAEAEDRRRDRLGREADRDLRMTDDPDARRAGERARTERTRDGLLRDIDELKGVLGILSPEQGGYADSERQLKVLEERLLEINETLRQMGGASPVSFMGGGEARVWNASFGGPHYPGNPGNGSRRSGHGDAGGARIAPDAAGSVGAGRPGLRATGNPGGAAGELYDVWSTSFSDAQAFALLGHAEKESGFDPNAWNAGEQAGGILQWRGNRLENLKGFAASKGMDWRDRSVQAAFVAHEMETDPYEKRRSARFRSATTIEEASAALEDYVRFGDGSGAERLGNARRHAGAFGAGRGSPAAAVGAGGSMAPVTYANAGATRNKPITPELMAEIQRGVSAVYGEGYRAEIYSGGQDRIGEGGRRTGSTRHDGGRAADVYVYGPDGERLSGEALGRLGQHWLATGQGGVGMEMRGGGIHLDEHRDRARAWSYGGYRPGQAEQVRKGLAGIPPEYANPAALDPAAMANADHRLPSPDARAPLPTRRPERGGPASGGGASPARSGPVSVVQNFRGGFDARTVAARAQREQSRSIRMAEARALHDTMVPIS